MVARPLGMFPLSTVLFPRAGLPLHVFENRYRTMMADCLDGDREFGVVLITRGSEVGGGDQRVNVGTVARIAQVAEAGDGRMLVTAQGLRRVRVCRWLPDDPYPWAMVDDLPVEPAGERDGSGGEAEVAVRRLRSLLSELGDVPAIPHDHHFLGSDEDVGWQLCASAPLNLLDRQQLLACDGHQPRMRLLAGLSNAMAEDVLGLLAGGLGG
jgi:Lon protease-like protein